MNMTQLEYFSCICEYGSVSRAAEKLFITQSALSQQLIRLEKSLGVQLFNRHGNVITLTESGERFLESVHTILFEFHNVVDILDEGAKHPKLTIAVTKTKSFITLSYLLPGFCAMHPDIEIQIKEVDSYQVEELLSRNDADLGFCYNPNDTKFIYHTIYDEPILLAAPFDHPLSRSKGKPPDSQYPSLTFAEIANEPFIIGTCGYLREYTLQLFNKHGAELRCAMETANPGMIHLLVSANIGMAFIGEISTWITPNRIPNPSYFLLQGEEQNSLKVAIAHHRRKFVTPSMAHFISYAQKHLGVKPSPAIIP